MEGIIHMKKIFLLLAVLFFANVVNAQVVITADITTNTTWTSGNEYMLDGLIFVDSLVTLTIEAGTVMKAKLQSNITTGDGASALIIRRGGKLIAEGTQTQPIIFTSELDDIGDPNDLLPSDRELWGGVILLGSANTNQPGENTQIEGIPLTENARFGGDNDDDDSGILRYVSIRHGGFSISGVPGDEINGLTMGAIGRNTIIEHVEVYANKDDGYEWFGGTVNCKWLVAAMCGDEAFDWDQGYRGYGQFWFGIQPDDEAGKGMEMDGGDDCESCTPYAEPTIVNLTLIGAGVGNTPGGDQNELALHLRDNSGGHFYSSIITDYVADGIIIEDLASGEDSRARLDAGQLTIEHVYWWGFGAGNVLDSIAKQDFVSTYLAGTGNNFVTDPQLGNISRDQSGSLDPRPLPTSPAVSGAMIPSDPFFTQVAYYGAFAPGVGLWTAGWTALSQDGITSVEEETYSASLPQSFNLSQNYPNPFNPTTKISYSVAEASNVKLTVYNILGQEVEVLLDGFKAAGNYELTFNAENLPSGLYIYSLEAGSTKITKKMTLLK